MQIAEKTIGNMIVSLHSENDMGAIVVCNKNHPDDIVCSTGFHIELNLIKESYEKIITPKNVHDYFDE